MNVSDDRGTRKLSEDVQGAMWLAAIVLVGVFLTVCWFAP